MDGADNSVLSARRRYSWLGLRDRIDWNCVSGDSPIERTIVALRESLDARLRVAQDRADQIKQAADGYVRAVEETLVAELTRAAGMPETKPTDPHQAALALRRQIELLPELEQQAAASHARATEAALSSRGSAPEHPRLSLENFEVEPEAAELWEELRSANFAAMPPPVLRAYASELAARARSLQDRGLNADDIPGRAIRKLTAIAYNMGVTVFGLKRSDRADWDELARRHRADRERAEIGEPRPLTQKLRLPANLLQKQENGDEGRRES